MLHLQSVSTIKQCVPNYHLLVVITIRGYFNGRYGSFFQKTCKKLYLATHLTKCYFVVFLYFLPKIQVLEFLYDHVIGRNNGFQHQMLISQSVFLYFDFPQNGSSKNVPFIRTCPVNISPKSIHLFMIMCSCQKFINLIYSTKEI